jgi:hypothetical protein
MNAPNRHELFVLEDGEKACVESGLVSRELKLNRSEASK